MCLRDADRVQALELLQLCAQFGAVVLLPLESFLQVLSLFPLTAQLVLQPQPVLRKHKNVTQIIKLQTTAWTRSTQCLKSLRTNILGESHLQLCPFMNLFSTYCLIPHSTPPRRPQLYFFTLVYRDLLAVSAEHRLFPAAPPSCLRPTGRSACAPAPTSVVYESQNMKRSVNLKECKRETESQPRQARIPLLKFLHGVLHFIHPLLKLHGLCLLFFCLAVRVLRNHTIWTNAQSVCVCVCVSAKDKVIIMLIYLYLSFVEHLHIESLDLVKLEP